MEEIITTACRNLRKNSTPAEKKLWSIIRAGKIGKKFYRQKPIFVFKENSGLDRYIIADFYSPENKLIIELDGNIHNRKDIYLLDKEKETLLKNRGYQVVRFKNEEVFENIDKVIKRINQ